MAPKTLFLVVLLEKGQDVSTLRSCENLITK